MTDIERMGEATYNTVEAAKRFVVANIELTLCQQYEFKQLCSRCWRYNACKIYAEWAEAWIDLSKLAGPSADEIVKLTSKYVR